MSVSVKVINNSQNPLPKYMTDGAVAVDLFSNENVEIPPKSSKLVDTGLRVAIPTGYELQIRSRSGLAAKNNVFVENSPGTIDQDYRGNVKVILYNLGETTFTITNGERIAQAVLAPVIKIVWEEVDTLDETTRSVGGFGSTGVNSP
jgi:dUTP pyrophosphatase